MRPLQLHFLKFFSPRKDLPSRPIPLPPPPPPPPPRVNNICLSCGSQEFLLQGKTPPPPFLLVCQSRRMPPTRVGSFSSSLPRVGDLVASRGPPSHQLSRTSGGFSCPSEFRRSGLWSINSDSIRQLHGGFQHKPSGRNSLDVSLQSHVRPVGLVSGERYSPLSFSRPRGRQPTGGLPLQREVPAFRMDPEPIYLPEDLPIVPTSGDRFVQISPDLPSFQILFVGSGPASVGYRHNIVPVVRPSSLRIPSVQPAPSSSSESGSRWNRPSSHSPALASETLVSSLAVSSS